MSSTHEDAVATASTNTALSAVDLPQGTFEVDADGQATYRIPIELPPGIAGYQPQLALVYGHRQPNGVMGVGWGLGGLSAINRTKATYAVDGFNDAVTYDSNDRYMLDGQRLINVQGDYGQPGTLYYTQLQTWKYVKAGATTTAGFNVTTKSGEVWKYGTTADSRILAAGSQNIRVWALSSMTDRNGNRVDYTYTQSPLLANGSRGTLGAGAYYIDRVAYTANGSAAANRFVQFVYEERPDVISDYLGGYPIITAYRLKQVSVSLANNVFVRSYNINYQLSNATRLSRVESIVQVGSDNTTALPPTKVIWQDVVTPGFDIGTSSVLDQHSNQVGLYPMDVNGDGRTDVVQLWVDQTSQINATTYLATPGPNGITFVRASNTLLGSFGTTPDTREIFPADVNGDGMTDLLIAYKAGNGNLKIAVFLSNGTGFVEAPAFDTGDGWLGSKHLKFFAMDANGDGRTDLVEAYIRTDPGQGDLLYFRSYLSKFGDGPGQTFTQAITSPTQDPATPATTVLAFWAMDVQGDGMMDLVRVWKRGSDLNVIATAYLSVSKSLYDVKFTGRVESNLGTFSLADQIAFLPIDVNGDGVMDLLQVWKSPSPQGTTLHLTTFLCNAAGGFTPGPDSTFENRTLGDFYPMAFNGGGQAALVNKWVTGGSDLMFSVFLASPAGTFREGTTFNAGVAVSGAQFVPGDVNGDGKADLLRLSVNQNQQSVLVPYTSKGVYPDLASVITNQIGGTVQVKYGPLSDPNIYTAGIDPPFPKGHGRRYPNPLTPTQFPVQAVLGQATYVVSGYTQTNDPSINRFSYEHVYTMKYSGARLDLLGRGWEGFQSVSKLTVNSGSNTITNYNQDYPYTGTVASARLEAAGTTPVLVQQGFSTYQAFTRATGATGLHPAVVEVLMTTSRIERYNNNQFDYALGQTFEYDNYGNQTKNVNLNYVNQNGTPLNPAEIVYRYNLYQNVILSEGWILGLLQYAKVSANATDANITQFLPGDYHLEKRTYTSPKYNLQSSAQWDNVHSVFLVTSYEYDSFGNRTAETVPGGAVTRWSFDPDYNTYQMQMTSPQNAQGQSLVTQYGYDPRFGIEVARREPTSQITVGGLDHFGRKTLSQGPVPDLPSAVGDPNGLTPLVTGTAAIKQAFLSAAVVTLEGMLYTFDAQKGLYSQVSSLQKFPVSTTREFAWKQKYVDGLARERETYDQTGQTAGNVVVLKDYNPEGKVTSESLPFFSATAIVSSAPHSILDTYDLLGRPLTHKVPSGADGNQFSVTNWAYGSGGLVNKTSGAGSDSAYVQVLEYHYYDGEQQVRKTVVPADNNATTTFQYDPIARLTRATDPATPSNPNGVPNTITYDSLDRKLTIDNPDQNTTNNPNIKAMAYEFDPTTGLLKRQTDAAGQVTTFAYDNLGRTTTKTLGDGTVIRYTYDDPACNGQGRLTQVKVLAPDQSLESQSDYCYDKYGNTSRTIVTVGGETTAFVTSSVYDPQQRLVIQTMPDNTALARQYSFGKLIGQSLDGALANYPLENYDPTGKAGKMVYGAGTLPGSGVVTEYTFNPLGQVYREVVTGSAGKVLDFSYQYDNLNQLLNINDLSGSTTNRSQVFTYLNQRLKTASIPGFSAASYTYDTSGNLITKEGASYTYQAHFPVRGVVNNQEVYSATRDACGRTNTRNAGGQNLTFAYDGLGCLRRVATASGDMLREILSDYQGKRLRQINADGSQVIYVSSAYQMTRTAQGTSSVIKQLLDDRGAAATIKTGTTREILYCRRDHKGSTTDFFGANGTIVESFSYSGYGQPHQLSGANAAGPRYEQRQWDDLVGLYYFGARYYDPVTGRFLTPDTQLGGTSLTQADVLNRFAFELNNPINNVDLTGHGLRDVLIGIGIGVALVAIGAAIILTGGAAAPLGAIAAGALVGAGLNAITYSATHTNQDAATFYKGFAVEVAVGAVVGGVTGAASLGVASVAETLSANAARQVAEGAGSRLTVFAIRAAVYVPAESAQGVASSTFNQFMLNVVDKEIGGEDISLDRSLDTAAATGAVTGAVKGVGKAGYGAATLPRHTEEEGLELRPFIAEQRTYGSVSSEPVDPGDLIRSRSMLFSLPVMFAGR
jgi:RHS repeat-associated protein